MVRRLRPSEALRRLDIIAERRALARRRRLERRDHVEPAPRDGLVTGEPEDGEDQDGADADAPGTPR